MWKQFFVVVAVIASGTYFLSTSPAQQPDAADVQNWRHLALTTKNDADAETSAKIVQLGSDGWQLVDVENFMSDGETVKTVFYFKKPG